MGVFRPNPSQGDSSGQSGNAPQTPSDPRLAPTPDYGTLGPGSDFAKSSAPASGAASGAPGPRRSAPPSARLLSVLAILGGVVSALLVSSRGGPISPREKFAGNSSGKRNSTAASAKFSARDLDREPPQKQAEILLTRAVTRNDGATEEIQARVHSWHGQLSWNPQLSQLTTVALNSNDQNVRASAIEVQIAAYGLTKTVAAADRLIRRTDVQDHSQKIWAMWALGLLANRGVETDRVVQVLSAHLNGPSKDPDDESRRWAAESLALVGTTSTIAPLLAAMHNDPSALVRERAACSLAESGMLTHEQRLTAVPQLINYSDDPALDAQTRGWAFQALHDITKQALPNDSAAWRNWYQTRTEN